MELCDACEGTGLLGFQRETCWFCDGTGKKKGGKQMDRQKVLDVLNSLEVIETNGGDEPYILVENNEKNRELLKSVGISEETIKKYGDDKTFCILSLACREGYANFYKDGKLVWLDRAGRTELIDDLIFEQVKRICEEYGFHCTIDSNYVTGRIVINVK